MFNFVISLILGMLPEVLYFTLFLIFTKDLKDKRLKLFLLLVAGYIVLIMLCRYQLIFYLAYIVYTYLVLKKLYKSHITDLFVYSVAFSYLMLIGFIFKLLLFDNYVLYYVIDRIFLFLPFIFKDKFNLLYEKYKSLWNRKKDNKIKSLTIRNSSVLFINVMIILINILTILALMDFTG